MYARPEQGLGQRSLTQGELQRPAGGSQGVRPQEGGHDRILRKVAAPTHSCLVTGQNYVQDCAADVFSTERDVLPVCSLKSLLIDQ